MAIFIHIQRVYDFFMKTELKRTTFGPPKTGFGFGIGGGDGRAKVDRVKAYFEENPESSCREAADVLQVRHMHDLESFLFFLTRWHTPRCQTPSAVVLSSN